jgi:hypothetical protein
MARYTFPIAEVSAYRYEIGKRVVEIDRNEEPISGIVRAVHWGRPGGVALVEIELDTAADR